MMLNNNFWFTDDAFMADFKIQNKIFLRKRAIKYENVGIYFRMLSTHDWYI